MSTTKQYVYRIKSVVRVTDGDTYWFDLDVGFRHSALVNIRLLGYDCPETNSGSTNEKMCGKGATNAALSWFSRYSNDKVSSLWVKTEQDPDSFGRWLGAVWVESDGDKWPEEYLGAYLRELGLASIWPKRWKEEFDV